jgi:ATP-dependent protease ClpP protease subunit/uncharacterized coiled-coil protein SlyX
MNWIYTVDVESDEPIMLINKHIGFDEVQGMGIDGALFQEELLRLDTLNKKRIQVWINSEGGIVMDGYKIFNAILKSKTKVDTYNVGIAASIAAVIFQAGRKRYMADYSLLMYHNPYGGDSVELKKMRESLAIMISERTGKSVDFVLKMMDRTTWIGASEALTTGFCDEIEYSNEANVKHGNAKAMWTTGRQMANSIFQPKNKTNMTRVANMLGLNTDANEQSIVAEITAIMNKKAEMEDKKAEMEDKLNKMADDYAEAKQTCDKLKAEMDELKAKMEDAEKAKAKAEDEAKKAEAEKMVDDSVKQGKVKPEAKNSWVAMAIKNMAETKTLLESLPTNGKAVSVTVSQTANDAELQMVAARAMQEVRNKLNIN